MGGLFTCVKSSVTISRNTVIPSMFLTVLTVYSHSGKEPKVLMGRVLSASSVITRYCDDHVCLFDCLFVCLSARVTRRTARPNFTYFYACCLWPCLGPPPKALRYVMYFRFYGWRYVSIPCDQWADGLKQNKIAGQNY